MVGVGIALLFLVWAFPGFRNPAYQQDRYQHAKNSETGKDNPVVRPSLWETYTSPTDTYAQWIAAFSALFSVGVSVWAVWLVRSTLELNRDATKAAVEANQLSREVFIADQRAWIEIEAVEIISPLTWNRENREGRLTIRFTVKNTGRTLAKGAWIRAEFISFEKSPGLSTLPDHHSNMPKIMGFSVFPGKIAVQEHDIPIGKETIDSIAELFDLDPWQSAVPVPVRLLVSVHYWLVVSDERHHTGGLLDLVRADLPGNVAYGPGFGDMPAAQLRFQRGVVGDFVAD